MEITFLRSTLWPIWTNLNSNFLKYPKCIHFKFHEWKLLPLDSIKEIVHDLRKTNCINERRKEGIFSIVCCAYDKFLVIYLNFPCLSVAIRKTFIHARKAKQMFLISEFVFRFLRLLEWLKVTSCQAGIFHIQSKPGNFVFQLIWEIRFTLPSTHPESLKYFIHAHTKTFAILHVHVFQSLVPSFHPKGNFSGRIMWEVLSRYEAN